MKILVGKKRLNFLVGFATFIYVMLFLSLIKSNLDDFLMGFTVGYHYSDKKEDSLNPNISDVYFLKVKPTGGVLSFPDSLKNSNQGEYENTRYYEMRVAFPKGKKIPSSISIYEGIKTFLSFLTLFVFVFIGVKFFQLMSSFKEEIVFDQKVIKNISHIGKALVILYLSGQFYNELTNKINCTLFSFSNYKIVSENMDLAWLLLGIVIMIFAEIVSRGRILKEEQELTI
jgi:hypothetical protein